MLAQNAESLRCALSITMPVVRSNVINRHASLTVDGVVEHLCRAVISQVQSEHIRVCYNFTLFQVQVEIKPLWEFSVCSVCNFQTM